MKAVQHIYFFFERRYDMFRQVDLHTGITEIMDNRVAIFDGFRIFVYQPIEIQRGKITLIFGGECSGFRILIVQSHEMLIIGSCYIFSQRFGGKGQ